MEQTNTIWNRSNGDQLNWKALFDKTLQFTQFDFLDVI